MISTTSGQNQQQLPTSRMNMRIMLLRQHQCCYYATRIPYYASRSSGRTLLQQRGPSFSSSSLSVSRTASRQHHSQNMIFSSRTNINTSSRWWTTTTRMMPDHYDHPRFARSTATTSTTTTTTPKKAIPTPATMPPPAMPHIKQWILFSDLHVTPRSLPSCLSILRTVHAAAASRSAGIAFLGDFWHFRGSLPIEPLNALVRLLANEWRVPTLALVGNHDQTDMSGMTHGLTPLAAAAPDYLHIIDTPTVFANALWLPYRRNSDVLVDCIQSSTQIEAIFAHVDVKGAFFNEAFQSRDGLPPSIFPPHLPVYTGHYHHPHTVPNTRIRYVGSPYQVSKAEAGQSKALLVVDASQEWRVVEEIPLDIGPRHFTIQSIDQLDAQNLRAGDKVYWTYSHGAGAGSSGTGDEGEVGRAKKELQKIGVHVEMVAQEEEVVAVASNDGGIEPNREVLGPLEVFEKYAAARGLSPEVVVKGKGVLQDVLAHHGSSSTTSTTSNGVVLSFSAVEIEGFLSFIEPTRYNLQDRGLVIVTGQLEHDLPRLDVIAGAESNGTGKTSLVMAPLWALTGDIDTRSDTGTAGRGLTNADVVNEACKRARVRVEGTIDGVPFTVERSVVRRGRGGGLVFEYNGVDKTQQDARMTQVLIEEAVATPLLRKTCFYGQSEITALLEANDKTFKEDYLGAIVDLEVWAAAKEASKGALSGARAALTRLSGEIKAVERYADGELQQVQGLERKIAAGVVRMEEEEQADAAVVAVSTKTYVAKKKQLQRAVDLHIDNYFSAYGGSGDAAAVAVEEEERALQEQRGALGAVFRTTQQQIERYRRGEAQRNNGAEEDQVCDHCLQPIRNKQVLHEKVQALMEEVAQGRREMEKIERRMAVVAEEKRVWREVKGVLEDARKELSCIVAEEAEEESGLLEDDKREEDDVIGTSQQPHKVLLPRLVQITQETKQARQAVEAAMVKVRAQQTSSASLQVQALKDELHRRRQSLQEQVNAMQEIEKSIAVTQKEISALRAVDEAFRPAGIVSFVVEGALATLQYVANQYLTRLAPDMALKLSATSGCSTGGAQAQQQIEKAILVGTNEDKESISQRSVKQLSGGERRRVGVALALGFTELAARRGKLQCDLLVLDEVMQHLDEEGCVRLASLLRTMDQFKTVLVVAQAQSFMAREFDYVDVVTCRKAGGGMGGSRVVGGGS